jgi:hypothetical protein
VVIGLENDAGESGSNPVSDCKDIYMCSMCIEYIKHCIFYSLCEFFLFYHAYFFATDSAEGQNGFLPRYPSNE